MSTRTSNESDGASSEVTYEQVFDGKIGKATAFEPGWRAATTGGAILLGFCLIGNIVTLIWASVRTPIQGAPQTDGNPVLFDGDCGRVNTIKTWSHLAINIVSTLILSTSTVCMQCLSAPTRIEVDEAHRKGQWLDVGILSTRNLRNIPAIRIFLYTLLGFTSIPLHLFYNSVIFSTVGTYDSLTLLTTSEFPSLGATNDTHIAYLHDWLRNQTYEGSKQGSQGDLALPYTTPSRSLTSLTTQYSTGASPTLASSSVDGGETGIPYQGLDEYRANNLHGAFLGEDPWQTAIDVSDAMPSLGQLEAVIKKMSAATGGTDLVRASAKDCISSFSSTPLQNLQNVVVVTSLASNANGTLIDMDMSLAPGRPHWTCNHGDWMYNSSSWFFSTCFLRAQQFELDRNLVASNVTDPLPEGYWIVEECYYQQAPERCTIVFAKWLMIVVVVSNILKLAAMIYTVKILDFEPCITVGDMVGSFLRKPDMYTAGINPHSNLSIKESYRYEVSRIHAEEHPGLKDFIGPKAGRHEALMHQTSWDSKPQRWRSAASARRWSVTMGLWASAVAAGVSLVAVQGTVSGSTWSDAWSQGLGQTSPDYVLPVLTPPSSALLSQTIVANIPQIFVSGVYVFYSGLLTTMLSAQELAGYATTAKTLRVSPPKSGAQRSSYFLQVPYRFAIPILASMALLHWLVSQSIYLVRLDEYDIQGNEKWPSFESVVGYSLQGTLAATVTGFGMLAFPVVLGFLKLPDGIPLVSHNTIAISIACHPFPDEPGRQDEKPLRYGRIMGTDKNGVQRSRIGFSAGDVEPLRGGEQLEDTRCLSTLLFLEHGLEHACTLDRNSWNLFVKVMKGGVKVA